MSDTTRLAAGTTACFVGDVHLGDGARNDAFGTKDEALVAFLDDCPGRVDAVVFMGDVVDIPQGWTVRRILGAHAGVAGAIERLTERVPVYFIRGNHDWRVQYRRIFPCARECEELLIGDILVWHGHRLDRQCRPDSAGYPLQVGLHHLAERLLGFDFRVPLHEHYTFQNRVAHWLGHSYARLLRRRASSAHARGDTAAAARHEDFIDYWSRAVWGDIHAFFAPVTDLVRNGPYEAVVCGHTHLPGVVDVADRCYVNAGSWTFEASEVAEYDGSGFEVVDVVTGRPAGSEHYTWMADGVDPGDFFAWWEQAYLGGLRFRRPALPARTEA